MMGLHHAHFAGFSEEKKRAPFVVSCIVPLRSLKQFFSKEMFPQIVFF